MCGIVGIFNRRGDRTASESDLGQMLSLLRHRGPDEFGMLLDREAGMGNARLSIVDLQGGIQPIANEDETLWIVFNGEVFNYPELREELVARGHRLRTATDTEVVLHLFEDLGPACLERLNGQFAIAIWDSLRRRIFLARDRLGVRPLFYTETGDGTLLFASEIKALLGDPRVSRELDPRGLAEVFTLWAAQSPNTVFRGIRELEPGHWMVVDRERVESECYWSCRFASQSDGTAAPDLEEAVEQLRALLIASCRIRLRADVPVGAYLSGGVDSSTIASIVRQHTSSCLATFSIAFADEAFDESAFQGEMARSLGTEHHVVRASWSDIGNAFPEVVWHAETPLMRTAPAPMFLLSKLVRESGFKVVLTGEGADEFLAGYDIFREAKIRRFWARRPESALRPLLLGRLYPDIGGLARTHPSILRAFFGEGLCDVDSPWFSHAVRWRNNRRTLRFFADGVLGPPEPELAGSLAERLPPGFREWPPLAQAQYIEITTFLSPYLLSSQGDRMSMAHSVEGRFPFLDVHLVEFCNALPAEMKLPALREKHLLKKAVRPWLPEAIRRRPKRPYRAPVHRSFFHEGAPEYVRELLSPEAVRTAGIFRPGAVDQLVRKIEGGATPGETDDMALVGILSTQLVHHQFIRHLRRPEPLAIDDRVRVCRLKRAG